MATLEPVDYDPFATAPQGQRQAPLRMTITPRGAPVPPQAVVEPVEYDPFAQPQPLDPAFDAFAQPQALDPALRQRGEDLSRVGETYGLSNPQEIMSVDRRAAEVADNGFVNSALQGATFNTADEIKALAQSIAGYAGYAPAVAGEREGLRRYKRDNPGTALAAELGGALATAPFLPMATVPGMAARVAPALPAIARGLAPVAERAAGGALTGAGYGALYGAGAGEGMQDRAQGAVGGAALGGALGGAVPVALSAAGATARGAGALANAVTGNPVATMRGVMNPDAEAARRVVSALTRDNPSQLMQDIGQGLQRAVARGEPQVLADRGGETTRALARSAANTSPEGRQALTEFSSTRFEGQTERLSAIVNRLMGRGGRGDNIRLLDQLDRAARRANKPLYDRAYADGAGGVWTSELEGMLQSPTVADAVRSATRRGNDRAVMEGHPPVRNPFASDDAGNLTLRVNEDGSRAVPNLQFWDAVQRNLRAVEERARTAGDKTLASEAGALRTQMLGHLDDAVPSFRQARATAASFFGAEDALQAGEKFVMSTRRNDEARAALAKMNGAERQLFAEGFATGLVNRVFEARDRTNVINAVFGAPAARERIQMALGAHRAGALEVFVRRENMMDLLRSAVLGNSTTAQQQWTQRIQAALSGGAAGGAAIGGGVLLSGGSLQDPRTWITAAALHFGRGRLQARAMIAESRVAERVADLLLTDDPARLAAAVGTVAASPTLAKALRTIEQNLSKIASEGAGQSNVPPSFTGVGGAQEGDPQAPR